MECPQCPAETALGAKYCGGCGRPLQLLSCRHCGADNPAASKFCHECGRVLAGMPVSSGDDRTDDRNLVTAPDDAEEIKDCAFWESYADRTGIPAAGLIEVTPGPEPTRRESPGEGRDRRPPLRRGRERGLHTTLQEDRERRRPMRIIVAAGTILAVGLILLVLSTKSWHAVLGPLRPDIIVAPPDQPTVATAPGDSTPVPTAPVPEVIPAPAAPAPPVAAPSVAEEVRAEERALDAAAQPGQRPTTPRTSVEHMATFLVERDGPERAIQTARAVASFYPARSADFTYWQQVIAAIRASTAPKGEPGAAGSDAITAPTADRSPAAPR